MNFLEFYQKTLLNLKYFKKILLNDQFYLEIFILVMEI